MYDGFHSPRENVLGLALTPLDDSFVQLKLFSDPMYAEPATFEVVLRGLLHAQITKPEQVQASILAMCRKSLEDSLEKASIGHNAEPAAAVRHRPAAASRAGPLVGGPGHEQHLRNAARPSLGNPGAPHPVYLPLVRQLKRDNKLEAADVNTLRQIVTDGYFRQANANPKDKAALQKAKATAWLLCYYLARNEPAKLLAYFKELEKLPPDLDLDEEALMNCFARAFGLWDGNQKKLDEDGLRRLTAGAISDLSTLEMELDDLIYCYTHFAELVTKAQTPKPGPTPPGPGYRPGN